MRRRAHNRQGIAHAIARPEVMSMLKLALDATQVQASELIDNDRLFTQLSSYKHNPRVRILSLGRSVRGADIPLVAIGEPAVLADLEGACRKAALYYTPRIAHRTWDAVDAIVAELPLSPDVRVPVLIEGGTFGFEASHTEGLLQAIDYLATQDTEAVRQILSLTVALFIPMANPDGRDLAIRQWQAFPLSAGHDGAGNAYGFYLNRDFFHLTQPESKAVLRAVTDYTPLACLDTHEDMFLLGVEDPEHVCFCPPFARGHNPEVDQDVMAATNRLGSAIARRWRQEGFNPLYSEQGDHTFLAPPKPEDRGKVVSHMAGLDGRLELILQLHGIPALITESARTPGTQTWMDRNRQKFTAS